MSRPFPPRQYPPRDFTRVNNKIRAREVRVIGDNSEQLGVMGLNEALAMARQRGVDLVEIAATATPPVCRLVDFGKYRYEQSKKDKETKKHQHANKVKEIQLSANIDPHDFGVKLSHAIDFLCEDMKVKVSLRFRGREMAHQEFGFGQVQKFVKEVAPYGHPDAPPKMIGRGLNVMLSPLPRTKRAKNPNPNARTYEEQDAAKAAAEKEEGEGEAPAPAKPVKKKVSTDAAQNGNFGQAPFAELDTTGGRK
ncbi:MAG: translation initiation factor IF-3 [Limisphaerales bacterium]